MKLIKNKKERWGERERNTIISLGGEMGGDLLHFNIWLIVK